MSSPSIAEQLAQPCDCAECESAVSPGAYLATLLDYVLKHVRSTQGVMTEYALRERLHQPFGDLPLDCSAFETTVSQYRIAVEVLRGYVGTRPLLGVERESELTAAEERYLQAAYQSLLASAGTTYQEMRRSRGAPSEERAALAERLGIPLTPPAASAARNDELDQLVRSTEVPVGDPLRLTEPALERLFGLGDSTADALNDGAKTGDAAGQIAHWRIRGADPVRNTDAEGKVHLSVAATGGAYVVSVYADAARTRLVAQGARTSPEGRVQLKPRNRSGLSGDIELRYTVDAADASVAVAGLMLVWRLQHLRSSWFAQDWPDVPPADVGSEPPLSLVDPQTIGLADLRNPVAGDAAYDLWLARTKELADRRTALVAARDAAPDPASQIAAMVSLALSLPGAAPVTVTQLTDADDAERRGERIGTRLAAMGLTAPGFRFLLPVVRLVQSGVPISKPEWELVFDTLVVARKLRDGEAWRAAEHAARLTLSPDHFRAASEDFAPDNARQVNLPLWLSTRQLRRRWSEVLTARVEQESNVVAASRRAVDLAEEQTLPLLRDALVLASDAEGTALADKGEWLTRRLLVDMRTSGAKRTTRIAQAMETLQEMMMRLRTGQRPLDVPSADLSSLRAIATADGRTHLVASDGRGVLWHRVWDGRWRSWRHRGALPTVAGVLPSSVAATARGNGFDIAVVAGNPRLLWVRRFENYWSEWQAVAGGPELTGSPALASSGADVLDAYVSRIGDLELHRRRWDGTAWSPAEDIGTTSHRTPAVVTRTADTADIIVTRPAAALFGPVHRSWDGATWTDVNLDGSLSSDPVLVAPNATNLELYQTRGGHLQRKLFNGAWQPWEDLDAGLSASDPVLELERPPAVCVPAPDVVTVYGLRRDGMGTALWFRRLDGGVWSAWERLPDDGMELDAIQFDAEWEWVGSYPTLRSATFVRLYPENLLLPSLAPRQTPAFRTLAAASRPTQRLTKERACTLAGTYAGYLRDVSLLKIQATCHVVATLGTGDPCATSAPVTRGVKLMFGLAPSGNVYWSMFDPFNAPTGYGQAFWEMVPQSGDGPPTRVRRIVGAIPWMNDADRQHHVHLFVEVELPGSRAIKRTSVDVKRLQSEGAWSGALEDVELPPGYGGKVYGLTSTAVLPVQSQNLTEAPRLAFHDDTTDTVYIRPLSPTGGFAAGEWKNFEITPYVNNKDLVSPESVRALAAALRIGGRDWIVYWSPSSLKVYANHPLSRAAPVADSFNAFHGALIGGSSSVFVFHEHDGENVYIRVTFDQAAPGNMALGKRQRCPGVERVVPHSEFGANFFVSPTGSRSYARQCRVEGDRLVSASKFDTVPVFGPSPHIPSGGTVTEMQSRRSVVRKVYDDNASGSETIRTYLREAFRLVPQQLGLALQAAGHYVAALDWFATVYDHRAPLADRYIDHGLALDVALPATSTMRFPEGWLLDPLNPHEIARTRRAASARYAIATTMQCLNDYADAQFSLDTNESLPIARMLYDVVLQLADAYAPRRNDHDHDCGALLSALEVRPGEAVPPEVAAALGEIAEELSPGGTLLGMLGLADLVGMAKKGLVQWQSVLPSLKEFAKAQQAVAPPPLTGVQILAASAAKRAALHAALLTDADVERAAMMAGSVGSTIGLPVALAKEELV